MTISAFIDYVNRTHTEITKNFIESGDIAIKDKSIRLSDERYIQLLTFLPFIYPEMDKNTYSVYVTNLYAGELSYNGIPSQPKEKYKFIAGTDCTLSLTKVTFKGTIKV